MEQLGTWGAQLVTALQDTVETLIGYLPALLTAGGLLLIGWLLARVARGVTAKTIRSLDWVFARVAMRSAETSRVFREAASRITSSIVFWVVLLVFATAALRTLGGPMLEGWTQNLLAYLPRLIGGIAIILLGFVGGTLARHVVEQAAAGVSVANSALFGRLSQSIVVLTGFVIGVDQLGVNVTFLTQLAVVIVAACLGGIALLLALGTRRHLANLIGARYARKYYAIGDLVQIGRFEGRIVEISDGCLFLDTAEGDVSVPAAYFTNEPFVKLKSGQAQPLNEEAKQ